METMINEDRLFKLIPYFFDSPSSLIVELAQNASRAKAKNLYISLVDECKLMVYDDGEGASNATALLKLAESNWTKEVEQQNPAGWGIYFLLSVCDRVRFMSNFGTLNIDCNRFLNESQYRSTILSEVDNSSSYNGFTIVAMLKKEVVKALFSKAYDLGYFEINIFINDKKIDRLSAESLYAEYPIQTSYMGNRVYINPVLHWHSCFSSSAKDVVNSCQTIWYGINIGPQGIYKNEVVIDVKKGSPLTPVLPYRSAIQVDEKLEAFWQFIRTEIVKFATDKINHTESIVDKHYLRQLMSVMSRIATQDEIDSLNRFYIKEEELFCAEEAGGHSLEYCIVSKGDKVISEELESMLDKPNGTTVKISDLAPVLCLPKGIFIQRSADERKPSWLRIEEVLYHIELDYNKDEKGGINYNWYKSKISCYEGKDIKCLALVEGWSCGDIYFCDSPNDVYDVDLSIFNKNVYNDDGDTYDSQKDAFDNDISEDISRITNNFSITDLLKGFYRTEIRPDKVRSIVIDGGTMTVKSTDDDGTEVISELKVA